MKKVSFSTCQSVHHIVDAGGKPFLMHCFDREWIPYVTIRNFRTAFKPKNWSGKLPTTDNAAGIMPAE